MVKYILPLLCITSLFGAELAWQKSYAEAVKKAKQEHKRVLLLITSETCKWCRKLEATTLEDETVIRRLQKEYIVVNVTRYKDDYPKRFSAVVVPMSYFLTSNEEIIRRGVMGYWSSEDYLSIMDDIDRYYHKKSSKYLQKK